MRLGELSPAIGSTTSRKRLGRGIGSGLGKTSGKGHKGQWARSGGGVRPGFEGGQMPLIRRIPKRGFNNHFKKVYSIVNLSVLEGFEANSVVDMQALNEKGLIKVVKGSIGLKVLGNGTLTKALTVKAAGFSASAKEAIEKAGGKAEQI
ncbi:MAG: 50S ribosomal protein L15 [Clostridia bacterium]|nr:50S ribosomal protein L15 [Clostridia bacterium]